MAIRTDDHIGEQFGDWIILSRFDGRKLLCKCKYCGLEKAINKYSLLNGASLQCKHNKDDCNIIGTKIGEWDVLSKSTEYGKLTCKCSCGKIKAVSKARLLEGRTLSCGHNIFQDLTGNTYGVLNVIEYDKDKHDYLCKCSVCGAEKYLRKHEIINEDHSVCNCKKIYNLKGNTFGEWEVIEHNSDGTWMCRCSCGNFRNIQTQALVSGSSKSCGHNTTGLKNLVGQKFGMLTVLRYLGNSTWECICDCGKIVETHRWNLLNNKDVSCGCNIDKYKGIRTKLEKYGEVCMTKLESPREDWQIQVIRSRERLVEFIQKTFRSKPTITNLSQVLGISNSVVCTYIHRYAIEDYITILDNESDKEIELYNFILNNFDLEVDRHNKEILSGLELDIYIPEKKVAIEFNGNYWHSFPNKNKHYHQQKTIECAKQGIQLIHIFEYEWDKDKNKILRFLLDKLSDNEIIYARNTSLKLLNRYECEMFLHENHLQDYTQSSINIGLLLNNELVSVMTFGKPRFNNNYQYELIRYCNKNNKLIVGGAEKLFNYFLKEFNPHSIITYTDIAKFTGNVYTKLGFRPIQPNPITEPNYVWVSHDGNKVLHRYDTMKHKLIKQGLGTEDQTEDEIMKELDFFKIYDSGNLRLEWRNKNDS